MTPDDEKRLSIIRTAFNIAGGNDINDDDINHMLKLIDAKDRRIAEYEGILKCSKSIIEIGIEWTGHSQLERDNWKGHAEIMIAVINATLTHKADADASAAP